jgi:hypothetical protein
MCHSADRLSLCTHTHTHTHIYIHTHRTRHKPRQCMHAQIKKRYIYMYIYIHTHTYPISYRYCQLSLGVRCDFDAINGCNNICFCSCRSWSRGFAIRASSSVKSDLYMRIYTYFIYLCHGWHVLSFSM